METKTVVFFDGVCNFCNKSVNFIIDNNTDKNVYFASLQSEYAQKTLIPFGINTNDLDSIILLEKNKIYQKSTAALNICSHFDWKWKWMKFFLIIPKPIRDFIYSFIAKKRYTLFGKSDSCRLPSTETKARFLG